MTPFVIVTTLLLLAANVNGQQQQQGNLRTNAQRRKLQDSPPPDCNPVSVNFNTAANGTPLPGGLYVNDEWIELGLVLKASGGVGTFPRLFDALNPRGPNGSGGDADLGSPNESCPVPGPGIGQGGAGRNW